MERSQATKRKLPFSGIQRRVRARKEPEPEVEDQDSNSSEEGSDEQEASEASGDEDVSQSDPSGDEAEESEEEDATNPSLSASKVSFGALVKAQASLPNLRRKGKKDDPSSNSDSDSGFEAEDRHQYTTKPMARSSKHAPAEQTSKRAVSRKREVVLVAKRQARDPRFGPLGGDPGAAPLSEERARRKYGFLDEYRNSEMSELRAVIKKTREPAAKEQLQRALASMQSRKQAQQRKDAERTVVEEHRKQDKELVKQGKKPFYLKKSEQKKRLLLDRFAGMKKREVDRAIERRRKKVTSKERKEMPMERRER
jgi:ribosomal RNA-processing protein 36